MRLVFWLLLFVDLLLFVTLQWGHPSQPTGETAPLPQAEVQAERLRLAHAESVKATSPSRTEPAAPRPSSAPTPIPAPAVVTNNPPTPAPTTNLPTDRHPIGDPHICMEWGDFTGPNLNRAENGLAGLSLNKQIRRQIVERSNGFWVYIPPLPNQNALDQRIAKLKADGIHEYFVVQEPGKWHNAVSLGLFRFREMAEGHLANLRAGKVPEAQLDEYMSRAKLTVFNLHDLDATQAKKLTTLSGRFPGSTLKTVACPP